MLKLNKPRHRPLAAINVVPYIDVMLVLLIIFMITTPLLSQGIKLNLPEAHAEIITPEQQPIVISIDAEGHYYINALALPLDATGLSQHIAQQLQAATHQGLQPPVLIRADKKIDYGHVVMVMVLLQQAGIKNIGLATETPAKT